MKRLKRVLILTICLCLGLSVPSGAHREARPPDGYRLREAMARRERFDRPYDGELGSAFYFVVGLDSGPDRYEIWGYYQPGGLPLDGAVDPIAHLGFIPYQRVPDVVLWGRAAAGEASLRERMGLNRTVYSFQAEREGVDYLYALMIREGMGFAEEELARMAGSMAFVEDLAESNHLLDHLNHLVAPAGVPLCLPVDAGPFALLHPVGEEGDAPAQVQAASLWQRELGPRLS